MEQTQDAIIGVSEYPVRSRIAQSILAPVKPLRLGAILANAIYFNIRENCLERGNLIYTYANGIFPRKQQAIKDRFKFRMRFPSTHQSTLGKKLAPLFFRGEIGMYAGARILTENYQYQNSILIVGLGAESQKEETVKKMKSLDDETIVKDDDGLRQTRDIVDYIGITRKIVLGGFLNCSCEAKTGTKS